MLNKIFISLFSIIIGFALGFFLSDLKVGEEKTVSFDDCKNLAVDRLLETSYIEPERISPQEVKVVNGVIKDLKGAEVALSIKPLSPLSDPELDERVVVITDSTKIMKTIKKDASAYNEEMKEFSQNGRKTATDSNSPFFYETVEVDRNSLLVGDNVTVQSLSNIVDEKNFVAEKITVR